MDTPLFFPLSAEAHTIGWQEVCSIRYRITIISGSMRIRTKSKTSFTRYPSTPQIPISSPSMGITATDRLKVPITLWVKSIAVITSSRTQIRNPAAAASRFFFHPKLRNIPKRSFKFFSVFISNFLIILYERQARDSIHRLFCRLLNFRRSPDVYKSKTAGSCLVSGCFLTVVKLSSSGTDQMLRGQIPAMAAGIRSRCSQTQ